MKNGIIFILIGVVIGFGCSEVSDQTAVADAPIALQELVKPGARIGMAYLNVEEGTDLEAFENYLATDYMAKWQKIYEAAGTETKVFLTKIVSGESEGKYGWITIFPDNETHELLFTPGGQTDLLTNAIEEVGLESFAPEFPGYVDWTHHGDANVIAIQ